uniref:Uncharacterized protein n=1 Tax=Leersia perrieri TaxID=77586 RepID=A0A0D9XT53_9ORYZ
MKHNDLRTRRRDLQPKRTPRANLTLPHNHQRIILDLPRQQQIHLENPRRVLPPKLLFRRGAEQTTRHPPLDGRHDDDPPRLARALLVSLADEHEGGGVAEETAVVEGEDGDERRGEVRGGEGEGEGVETGVVDGGVEARRDGEADGEEGGEGSDEEEDG